METLKIIFIIFIILLIYHIFLTKLNYLVLEKNENFETTSKKNYKFNFIEKVVYINLEKRKDRKSEIEKELFTYFDPNKIIRFNAIKNKKGYIGCIKSHIAALQMAIDNKWNNCLIVEDDMMWSDFNKGYSILENLVKKDYDVIVLGGTYVNYNDDYKLNKCKTTTAYLIKNHYYSTLLENFKESLDLLLKTDIQSIFALDVYWNKLQKKDNWYIVVPSLSVQRPSYSDIQKRDMNYNNLFEKFKK